MTKCAAVGLEYFDDVPIAFRAIRSRARCIS